MSYNKIRSPFIVLVLIAIYSCGNAYASGETTAAAHSKVISVAIGQSFSPEKSLADLNLPLVGRTHREPILQSADNITSIVGWTEACYMPGSCYGSIGNDDIFFGLVSNYSGPNSFDIVLFLMSYDGGPRPWKLVASAFGVQGDKTGYRITHGSFDKKTMTVSLCDSSDKVVKKFDVSKAYFTLRLKDMKTDE